MAIASRILGPSRRRWRGMPAVQICRQPFPDPRAKSPEWADPLGVSHRLPAAFSRRGPGHAACCSRIRTISIFDNQMLVQCHHWGFRIAEISCPTKYSPEGSSIGFWCALRYGFGVLGVSIAGAATRAGLPVPPYLDWARAGHYTLSTEIVREAGRRHQKRRSAPAGRGRGSRLRPRPSIPLQLFRSLPCQGNDGIAGWWRRRSRGRCRRRAAGWG